MYHIQESGDKINKTPFPLVEMEFFKADSSGVKHNLNILGGQIVSV